MGNRLSRPAGERVQWATRLRGEHPMAGEVQNLQPTL